MPPTRRVGAYAKLLANYAADDAIIAAGEAAELLFVRGLAFCATSDSDGYVTDSQVTRYIGAGMRDAMKRARKLVEVGLWAEADGGFQVRSWVKIHESQEERGRALKADRERKAKERGIREAVQSESERNPDGQPPDRVPESLSLIQDRTEQSIAKRTDNGAARRDELFDTLAEVCGINTAQLTKSGRGSLNGALGQLRAVDATPNQVRVRANRYRQRYPDTTVTPPALAKHWSSLDGVEQLRTAGGNTRAAVAAQRNIPEGWI